MTIAILRYTILQSRLITQPTADGRILTKGAHAPDYLENGWKDSDQYSIRFECCFRVLEDRTPVFTNFKKVNRAVYRRYSNSALSNYNITNKVGIEQTLEREINRLISEIQDQKGTDGRS